MNEQPLVPGQQLRANLVRLCLPDPSTEELGELRGVPMPSLRVHDARVPPTGAVAVIELGDEAMFQRATTRVGETEVPTWLYEGNVHFDQSMAGIAEMLGRETAEQFLRRELGATVLELVSRSGDVASVRAHFVSGG
jgi:hypothetical protein